MAKFDIWLLALNADGTTPVKIMNSDEGSYLMFNHPPEDQLDFIADRAIESISRMVLRRTLGCSSPIPVFAPDQARKF